MVMGAGTGYLPGLCGQELPLALWVDAPVHPPTPGEEALDVALLKLGSGSVVCCCCCCNRRVREHQGQATGSAPAVHRDLP